MTEVLHIPSSSPPTSLSCASSGGEDRGTGGDETGLTDGYSKQLSLLAALVTVVRKSLVGCNIDREELSAMEIGWPTNVRHVAHVTFDRFNGFLGLPVEFEPEVPRRPPSASASVFGVSTESMQLSYDSRGNSVPTILLLMQRRLYAQGGLQAEGIFRINAENSQEEYVRDQLNRGMVPVDVDLHCLAGLIKAWFRELPSGVLDSLTQEQVMQCQSEEDCGELVSLLPPTESALLDWAINLMADVVQEERLNKMNARNIAMVFAPNMTQMADPLTALMYAVQVMNFLKTLIVKTLREREDSVVEYSTPASNLEPSDENGHQSPSQPCCPEDDDDDDTLDDNYEETQQAFVAQEPLLESSPDPDQDSNNLLTSFEKLVSDEEVEVETENRRKCGTGQSSSGSHHQKGPAKIRFRQQPMAAVVAELTVEKARGLSNLSRINSRIERIEAWR